MKKNVLVVAICLFMGFSATAAVANPKALKESKSKVVKPAAKKFKYNCVSWNWNTTCAGSMGSSVCGENIPTSGWDLLLLMAATMMEVDNILCPPPAQP